MKLSARSWLLMVSWLHVDGLIHRLCRSEIQKACVTEKSLDLGLRDYYPIYNFLKRLIMPVNVVAD